MPDGSGAQVEVTVAECPNCGYLDPGPRTLCPACSHQGMAEKKVAGKGTLVSWTTIRRPPKGIDASGPYTVAIVDLAAGVRLTGQLTDNAAQQASAGMPVSACGFSGLVPVFEQAQ